MSYLTFMANVFLLFYVIRFFEIYIFQICIIPFTIKVFLVNEITDYTPAQTYVGLGGKFFKNRFANNKSCFKHLTKAGF